MLLNTLKVTVAFSTKTAADAVSAFPSTYGALIFSVHISSVSPLFIGTGFSFDGGNQVLVSVQKPLGIILEQGDEDSSIVVANVDNSGSAARAGVKVGDALVAIQNASVQGQSLEYALDFIGKAPRVVNLRFLRKK